jgi:glycine betaine/proline transport system permease protein
MAVVATDPPLSGALLTRARVAQALLALAVLLAVAKPALPEGLVRLPEGMILPWDLWLQALFDFIKDDLGLIHVTRFLTDMLEVVLDATANLLHGKRRWPFLGPIPWTAIAAAAAMLGYWLGGWRLALLAGGAFVWTALVGQWELAMETMAVIVVAAPTAFALGVGLGILAWKRPWFDRALQPVLAVLQTLPFFTYLLPAVIFFKVGPTAGAVATIVYAIPPMILMTTLGLKKVPPEVVEAGKMAGASRWQMLSKVYLPTARTEILVGVNQVIMLCLAMVVLTAFIGMPGLGAKLLALMNSFRLGRSFEIGVTIVLLAITLDRLSKAWVDQAAGASREGRSVVAAHREKLTVLGAFAGFYVAAQFVQVFDHIGRRQDLSMGRELDAAGQGRARQ